MQISETRAKQGTGGRRVLMILCASLLLIAGGYALVAANLPSVDADLVGETTGATQATGTTTAN